MSCLSFCVKREASQPSFPPAPPPPPPPPCMSNSVHPVKCQLASFSCGSLSSSDRTQERCGMSCEEHWALERTIAPRELAKEHIKAQQIAHPAFPCSLDATHLLRSMHGPQNPCSHFCTRCSQPNSEFESRCASKNDRHAQGNTTVTWGSKWQAGFACCQLLGVLGPHQIFPMADATTPHTGTTRPHTPSLSHSVQGAIRQSTQCTACAACSGVSEWSSNDFRAQASHQ